MVYIFRVQFHLEGQEVVGHLRRAGHLGRAVQAEDEQVHDEAVVLHDERGKLDEKKIELLSSFSLDGWNGFHLTNLSVRDRCYIF
jgi:hypothetical protein